MSKDGSEEEIYSRRGRSRGGGVHFKNCCCQFSQVIFFFGGGVKFWYTALFWSVRESERKLLHSSFLLSLRLSRPPSSRGTSCRQVGHTLKSWLTNSRKYRMFFILPSNNQNMSSNSIWLANNTEFSLSHKTRIHCLFAKPFPWSSTLMPKFLKSNLVSCELFHGCKDLAG